MVDYDDEYEDEFDDELEGEEEDGEGVDERVAGMSAWGISVVVHALILLIVGTVYFVNEITEKPPINLTKIEPPPKKEQEREERDVVKPEQTANIDADIPVEEPMVTQLDLPVEEVQTEDPVEMENKARGREEAVSSSEMASSGAFMAIGAGGGAAGAFGNRNGGGRRRAVGRYGGSRASESAVEAALKWFAIHQSPNGQWDVDAYPANCDEGGQLCEPGRGHTGKDGDTACSGYALLCYLGAGYDHKHMSKWRKVVKAGIEWLVAAQNADGSWGRNYENGICAMALAEAFALSGDAALREPAQKAIDYIISVQAKDGPEDSGYAGLGWDYKRPNLTRMDSSVSGWCVMALKSAKAGGLDTKGALEGCKKWLEGAWKCCNPNWESLDPYGKSYFPYTWNKTAGTFEHTRLPCVGLLAAVFLGYRQGDIILETLANTAVEEQMPAGYPCNTYWMYYNTLGVFQVGGERWEKWNASVRDMLVQAQRRDPPCFDGSWDFEGTKFHGHETGRLLSTAYCCLSLEVYYRYLPIAAGK